MAGVLGREPGIEVDCLPACHVDSSVLDVLEQCGCKMVGLLGPASRPIKLVLQCQLSGYPKPGGRKPFVYSAQIYTAGGASYRLVLKIGGLSSCPALEREIRNCEKMRRPDVVGEGLPQVFLPGAGCVVEDASGNKWGLIFYRHAADRSSGSFDSLHDWLASSLRSAAWGEELSHGYKAALDELVRDWCEAFGKGLEGDSPWRLEPKPSPGWSTRLQSGFDMTFRNLGSTARLARWESYLTESGLTPPSWDDLRRAAETVEARRLAGAIHGDLHAQNIVVWVAKDGRKISGSRVFAYDYEDIEDGGRESSGMVLWDVVKLQVELLVHLSVHLVADMPTAKRALVPGDGSAFDFLYYMCCRFLTPSASPTGTEPPSVPKGWHQDLADALLAAVGQIWRRWREAIQDRYDEDVSLCASDYLATLLQYCLYRGKYESSDGDHSEFLDGKYIPHRLFMSYLLAVLAARAIALGPGICCVTLEDVVEKYGDLLTEEQRLALADADGRRATRSGNGAAAGVLVTVLERLLTTLGHPPSGDDSAVGGMSLWERLSSQIPELSDHLGEAHLVFLSPDNEDADRIRRALVRLLGSALSRVGKAGVGGRFP